MSTKTQMKYVIRPMRNVMTGELSKRAYPIVNGAVGLDLLCVLLAQDKGVLAGKESYIKGFILSLFTKVKEILNEGKVVNIDNYLRLRPTIKGEVDSETGKPNENTILGTSVCALKGLKLSIGDFSLECLGGELAEPKIILIYAPSVEGNSRDQIVRGKVTHIQGRNLCYNAAQGDTLIASYTVEGIVHNETLEPTEVDCYGIRFAFPEAFSALSDNTEIEITLRTRLGVEDGPFSVASRKVVLVTK